MDRPLWKRSASELAALVGCGEVSALEVVDAHLERIAAVNPGVNAVTNVLADSARRAAGETDRRRAAGDSLGPLAGVPFTIKENLDVAGSATTNGVPALRDAVPPCDAPVVQRLREAGAIPIGRTNLPDLSLGLHTRSQLYGDTINPWDASRTPGGSSGGDGVAVATGMAPLGLGNDAGGSVRIPASFGGVVGLKPSYGRFPGDRSVGPRDLTLSSQLIPVDGPLARTVTDLRLACHVLAGPDPRDPRVVPAPLEGPPLPRPIRVALVADPGGLGVHPDVRAAIDLAASALRDAGYLLEEVDVPKLSETIDAYVRMIMTEFSLIWPMLERLLSADGRRHIAFSMALHGPVNLAEYVKLTAVRQGLLRDWSLFLDRYPLILGPVFTEPALPVAFETRGLDEFVRFETAVRLCRATSFVGVPAVAIPTHVASGLPQGVQVIAGFYREDLCFEAAAAIEARLGTFAPIEPCDASASQGEE
ncbi:amidase [Singulisphaera sp. GP187]|uniref:amidase n=1 Tax=Singulisphaera sp. GP187 TaxID=1882752 RepID=UPI000929B1E0|nr:amidase [Singulisphaera sp. GP187]SIO42820.1 amidase [Singulisphaera sp. GP187]